MSVTLKSNYWERLHMKANQNDWLCRNKVAAQPNWWSSLVAPLTLAQPSGGYCGALKWQECDEMDEKANTQRSRCLTSREQPGEILKTWVLGFRQRCAASRNLRVVYAHKVMACLSFKTGNTDLFHPGPQEDSSRWRAAIWHMSNTRRKWATTGLKINHSAKKNVSN